MAIRSGRAGTRTWAPQFEDLLGGAGCPTCAQGRPDDDGYGLRIYSSDLVDAYLQRRSALPGWTTVVWRGTHVCEPMDLSPEDACTFWSDVLKVAQALRAYFRPIKVNLGVQGNGQPHLHAHVTLRFADDAWPGQPVPTGVESLANAYSAGEYQRHAEVLRTLLRGGDLPGSGHPTRDRRARTPGSSAR